MRRDSLTLMATYEIEATNSAVARKFEKELGIFGLGLHTEHFLKELNLLSIN